MTISKGTLQCAFVVAGGYRMHTRVSVDPAPAGRLPLVLVHGLSVSSLYMIPTAREFAPHYRVYAPDLPGFGLSERPPHILDIGELAEALRAYLDAEGIERALFIANSLGCQTAAEFATRYPERFDRGILIGPTMDRHARTLVRQGVRLAHAAILEPLSQKIVVGYDYLRTGLRRTVQTAFHGLAHRLEDVLPQVTAPVIILRGSRDPIATPRWCHELASAAPRGRCVTVRQSAHTANWDEPEALLRVALPFFEQGTGEHGSAHAVLPATTPLRTEHARDSIRQLQDG